MRRRRKRPLRVKQPTEAVAEATRLAAELAEAGCSPEEQRLRVSQAVADPELAEAIISFVESQARNSKIRGNHERASGIYFAVVGALMIWGFVSLGLWMYNLVRVAPNESVPAMGAALGQAILVRMCWRIVKASGISVTDALNGATYPTVLHRPIVTTSEEDRIRRERLRLLIAEMVVRFDAGERFGDLYRELTALELTKAAAVWLLIQARIGVMIGRNFPPYQSRQRAYLVALTAAVGCWIGIMTIRDRLGSPAQLYYLGTWAALIVLEFLRPPRPAHAPEAI